MGLCYWLARQPVRKPCTPRAVTACAIAGEHDGRGDILSACSTASWSLWHSRQRVSVSADQPQPPSRFDLLIRNAHVFDGNGNPWIRADVGVTGDRIQAVGTLDGATATKTIDADGPRR